MAIMTTEEDLETAAMSMKLQGDVRELVRQEVALALQDYAFWNTVADKVPMASSLTNLSYFQNEVSRMVGNKLMTRF